MRGGSSRGEALAGALSAFKRLKSLRWKVNTAAAEGRANAALLARREAEWKRVLQAPHIKFTVSGARDDTETIPVVHDVTALTEIKTESMSAHQSPSPSAPR